MDNPRLSQFELRRYSYQISLPDIGVEGQEKIKKSKVLVIGAGGKGAMVLQQLVVAGVGKIGISDNDLVEENDLTKQNLYGISDLGKQKAIISRQKLMEINHLADIELHNICLNEKNILSICSGYDLLVDCTDNHASHNLISDTAIRLKIPVIYGITNPPEIHVTVFNYKNGPSYRCLYPEKKKKKNNPAGITTNGILCTVTGNIMANEVLKVILDFENTLSGKLLVFNLADYSLKLTGIERNPDHFTI